MTDIRWMFGKPKKHLENMLNDEITDEKWEFFVAHCPEVELLIDGRKRFVGRRRRRL